MNWGVHLIPETPTGSMQGAGLPAPAGGVLRPLSQPAGASPALRHAGLLLRAELAVILVSIGLSRVGGWEGLMAQAPAGMLGMAKPLDHELPITGFFLGNLVAGMFY